MSEAAKGGKLATCHCGSVALWLAAWPTEVTECNCSLCRSYGAIWAYYPAKDILRLPDRMVALDGLRLGANPSVKASS